MKKILAFIIATIVLLSLLSVSFAERFTIRNGIQFGMTKEEVMKIEAENSGVEPYQTEYAYGTTLFYEDINIAGFDLGYVMYKFDKNDKLVHMAYTWYMNYYSPNHSYQPSDKTHVFSIDAESKVYGELQQIYEVLNKALSEKYTEIGSYANGNFNYINFDTDENRGVYPYLFETGKGEYTDVYAITQYITNDENDYVEIVSSCCNEIYNNAHIISVKIIYRTVSEELYNSKQGELTVDEDKINSDL